MCEIHTSVIAKPNEYHLFKSPQELAANTLRSSRNRSGNEKIDKLIDPRNISVGLKLLQPSNVLIKDLQYSSELKNYEQIVILNALEDRSTHNPKLLKATFFQKNKGKATILKQLEERWACESNHFNKCAEIHFHRHVTEHNNLLNEDIKSLLIDKWNKFGRDLCCYNYQVITMIPRSNKQSTSVEIDFVKKLSSDIQSEFYTISENFFPNLQKYSIDNLRFYLQEKSKNDKTSLPSDETCDIHISLNSLAKLCTDGNELNALFKNEGKSTIFLHDETVPLKVVNTCEALEEALKLILISSVENRNADKLIRATDAKDHREFKPATINNFMERTYLNYKKRASDNIQHAIWNVNKGSQKLTICLKNEIFFTQENEKVIISIKIEYQTKFGAEQMTKEELMNEWIKLKFNGDCLLVRYRIDAKTLEIISHMKLNIEQIETELKESYSFDPCDMLNVMLNIFNCIRNLPESVYLIQAKNENELNKLLIYKESGIGKKLFTDDSIEISQNFTRKWIPIDRKIITFIHLNELFSPCTFPVREIKTSYVLNPSSLTSASSSTVKNKVKRIVKQSIPIKNETLKNRLRSKSRKLIANKNNRIF